MKIDSDVRFEMVMRRALGFTESQIAESLGVDQTTISYQLGKLREEARSSGSVELTFIRTISKSPRGLDIVLAGIRENFTGQGA